MSECSVEYCKKFNNRGELCEMHYYRLRRNGSLHYRKSNSKKIEFEEVNGGCFEVTSHARLSTGYYLMKHNYKRKSIHRHVYEELFGEIPEGLVVRHKCDNRSCINPEHLELGTFQDNMNDMVERDRSPRGVRNGNAILDEDKVREIRRLAHLGVKRSEICKMFNLKNVNNITAIKYGHSWSHVK